ncbi:MAG: hypothetical protein FWG79_05790 [Bacteroidales bacterium]|nr:hypothetical protein [Bacteroidales bacterium]
MGGSGFISDMNNRLKSNKRLSKRDTYYGRSRTSFDKKNTSLGELAKIPSETRRKFHRENRWSDIIGAIVTISLLAMIGFVAFCLYMGVR